jgi:hypothetical protein
LVEDGFINNGQILIRSTIDIGPAEHSSNNPQQAMEIFEGDEEIASFIALQSKNQTPENCSLTFGACISISLRK